MENILQPNAVRAWPATRIAIAAQPRSVIFVTGDFSPSGSPDASNVTFSRANSLIFRRRPRSNQRDLAVLLQDRDLRPAEAGLTARSVILMPPPWCRRRPASRRSCRWPPQNWPRGVSPVCTPGPARRAVADEQDALAAEANNVDGGRFSRTVAVLLKSDCRPDGAGDEAERNAAARRGNASHDVSPCDE